MVRTQISLEEELLSRAKETARREGISFAELCRRGLKKVVTPPHDEEAPWMRYAGILEGGSPDDSESVDRVVYDRDSP